MTASGHESGGGDRVTGTGHDDPPGEQGNANACAGTGSGQKTKTGPGESDPDEAGSSPKTATSQGGIHDPSVFLGQKTGKHGRIEKRERSSEKTPDTSPCRVCSDEWGEPTEEEAERATGDNRERNSPGSSTCEGAEETEASLRAPDEHPEALPPLSLDTWRAGGEEAPRKAAQGAP